MTKTLNQIIFFFLHQNQQHWEFKPSNFWNEAFVTFLFTKQCVHIYMHHISAYKHISYSGS
jgi:hypothetical protein